MSHLYSDVVLAMKAFDDSSVEEKKEFCRHFGISLAYVEPCNVYIGPEDADFLEVYEHIPYCEIRGLGSVPVDAFMEYMRGVMDSREE